MARQFLLALVVICWILRTYSRIGPILFERGHLRDLGTLVTIVSQVDLHVKIEDMAFLFERLVLRVAPCRIDGYIGSLSSGVFRTFLNDWQLLLECPLLVLKIVQYVKIFLIFVFLSIHFRVFVAGGSEATILVIILVLRGQIVLAMESYS